MTHEPLNIPRIDSSQTDVRSLIAELRERLGAELVLVAVAIARRLCP